MKMGASFLMFVLLLLAFTGHSSASLRTLDYTFNEDCNELCKNTKVKLAHVMATGSNDTIHYLWDFTENPSILIAVTSPSAKLKVNWKKYLARSPYALNFTEIPTYTLGIAMERLFEFNDVNDNARIDLVNDNWVSELNLNNFDWHHENMTKYDNLVEFKTEASGYKDNDRNETRKGQIKFLMHAFNSLNHSEINPHMLHSENATQMDIVFDHLETKKDFTASRFALELLIVSSTSPFNATLNKDDTRKLDDEFTPGVFEVIELKLPASYINSGYLQWSPVSYIYPERDVINSTSSISYPLKNATTNDYFNMHNLLYMYYGDKLWDNLARRMNISFGEKNDGFYKATNYATWTFVTGFGTIPAERFSSVTILIIALGIGIPVMSLLFAGIYALVRRRSRFNHELPIEPSILR
ncbi:glycosylated lysosomal membrane protein A-like [Trichogramma pretiosum]|uniref:glycosylated lysosomal membrane protein A-like n=1 Tax=Trichogramma pretiosum TaxID=7493 RepID=UPI0006C945EE|nr:glycosylated lysosomal membrane protein A-like [Trichogramma pretiosum]